MDQQRDAEAGVFHGPVLSGVGVVGRLARAAPRPLGILRPRRARRRRDAAQVRRAGDLAEAVRIGRLGLGLGEGAVGSLDVALVLPDRLHLADLLGQGHAREQVLDAGGDGPAGVLVGRRGPLRAGGADQTEAEGSGQGRPRPFPHRTSPHACDQSGSAAGRSSAGAAAGWSDPPSHRCWIASRLLPLVSGTKRITNSTASRLMPP